MLSCRFKSWAKASDSSSCLARSDILPCSSTKLWANSEASASVRNLKASVCNIATVKLSWLRFSWHSISSAWTSDSPRRCSNSEVLPCSSTRLRATSDTSECPTTKLSWQVVSCRLRSAAWATESRSCRCSSDEVSRSSARQLATSKALDRSTAKLSLEAASSRSKSATLASEAWNCCCRTSPTCTSFSASANLRCHSSSSVRRVARSSDSRSIWDCRASAQASRCSSCSSLHVRNSCICSMVFKCSEVLPCSSASFSAATAASASADFKSAWELLSWALKACPLPLTSESRLDKSEVLPCSLASCSAALAASASADFKRA
mmetsp:Transcript_96233/g.254221  ORF Transcript_96233/g.254221 Transcript_96233/m.254221 type:complete len:321 (+) Transcript_96233:1177-2139(+)